MSNALTQKVTKFVFLREPSTTICASYLFLAGIFSQNFHSTELNSINSNNKEQKKYFADSSLTPFPEFSLVVSS